MEFQVRQNWGQEIYAWEYFEMPDDATREEIELKAIQVIKDEWRHRKQNHFGLSAPQKCKPKIKVAQWDEAAGKKTKDGIRFETRWR